MTYTLNRKEIFAVVEAHLSQMLKQSSRNGQCLYRTGNNKCAIGALIPDEMYSRMMEGRCVAELLDDFPEFELFLAETYGQNKRLTQADYSFLEKLQRAHDDEQNWGSNGFSKDAIEELRRLTR